MAQLMTPLSDKELEALDRFLAAPSREKTSMDVATLEGFLVALAIGPELVMPSQWLPWVWDLYEGEADAQFEDMDEAERIMQLVMRFYNQVLRQFADDPEAFEPVYWRAPVWGAAEWCEGFLLGASLADEAWTPLLAQHPEWLEPFLRLGTSEGLAMTDREGDAEFWMNAVNPALVLMHAFWLEQRPQPPADNPRQEPRVRATPGVGRNTPCPCGSGKKYKHCCGAGGHTLH
jgi:uncharacterized protein